MDNIIPKTGFLDTLRFNLCHVVPYYLLGIFSQRPLISKLFRVFGIHPFHPKYCKNLRQRYASDYLYTRMGFTKALLVFDVNGINQILESSPEIYGVPDLKETGMKYFQPNSVTISDGHDWYERRQFNEFVLESANKTHSFGTNFINSIETLVKKHTTDNKAPCQWRDFSNLFEQVVQQIIFGESNRGNQKIFRRLMKLMSKANRIFLLRPSPAQARQDHELRARLHAPGKHSLLSRCPHMDLNPTVEPEHQVPHWLFGIGDTLASNVVRTLLLICSHPDIEKNVLSEIRNAGELTVESIDQLELLENCVQEAMRLWPTTSLLARKMRTRDNLQGRMLAAGTTVIILNNATHRDTDYQHDANQFNPDRWDNSRIDYAYNHLSNGPQVCAGKNLALFLAKTILASLLSTWKFKARNPSVSPSKPIPYINDYFSIRFRAVKL